MALELSALEARIVGCLMEKQVTTPDQYPLSLNALVNACNQKSNRDPVLNLDEREVQAAVDGLVRRQVVLEKSGFGSRVQKYHQIFCNTQFGSLKFSPQQTAIVCELLLRGPQTPGELRTHAARMAPIHGLEEVETALEDLATRPARTVRGAAAARAGPARVALCAALHRGNRLGRARGGAGRGAAGRGGDRRRDPRCPRGWTRWSRRWRHCASSWLRLQARFDNGTGT